MTARLLDSHAHIVSDDPIRYRPAPLSGTLDPGALDDPVTAERLLRLMDSQGVERAVAVQRAHIYGYDNSYVVDAAASYPDRLAAVCCIDALDPAGAEAVRHWVGERGAIGIRLTEPYKGSDASWFASPAAEPVWAAATALGASVCLHFYRWNRLDCLAALPGVVRRFPKTVVLVDHVSNLVAEAGPPDYGVDHPLRALVDTPNVYVKVTTLNLAKLATAAIDAAPILAHVAARFGARRVMWGSDIAQSKGSYPDMVALAHRAVAALTPQDQDWLLYGAAAAVYRQTKEPGA